MYDSMVFKSYIGEVKSTSSPTTIAIAAACTLYSGIGLCTATYDAEQGWTLASGMTLSARSAQLSRSTNQIQNT